MIFIKGIVNFRQFIKMLSIISLLFLTLIILVNVEKILDRKIYDERNQQEFRIIEMVSSDSENLLKKYADVIENYSLDGNTYRVIFKSIDEKEQFIENEDYFNHFEELISYTGGNNEFLNNLITVVNIVIIVIYILLFILIIILTLNYLNVILNDWNLFVILGYKNKFLTLFYFLLFLIIYSLMYVFCSLVGYLFTNYIKLDIIIFCILFFSMLIVIIIANNERKSKKK